MSLTLAVDGLQWWLELLKFALAVVLAFYIPGCLLLSSRVNKSFLVNLTLSILVGMVLWGWQEFIFGYLYLRNVSYFYLVFWLVIWLLKRGIFFFSSKRWGYVNKLKGVDWWLSLLVILGVFIQTVPLWREGTNFQGKGLIFMGGNTEDNFWHASLTYELVKRLPPLAPGFPWALLQNYHYWSNLLIASFVRVFKLPLFTTQFLFFPLLISSLLGMTIVAFGEILGLEKNIKRWLVFFVYFGGDLIYLLLFFLGSGKSIFSMSSLEDGTKFLYNPPRAFSFVLALGGISLLSLWQKKKNWVLGILSMFILASTAGYKIYTVLFFVPGIIILIILDLLKGHLKNLLIWFSFFPVLALIYLPTNSQAGGLVWAPLVIVNNFVAQPKLGLVRWEMARLIFLNDKKYLHNFFFETVFTCLFLVGILGSKILGFFQSPYFLFKKLGKELAIILLAGILISLMTGLFFIQLTGGANTFNFLVSVFLFGSILTALGVFYWQQKLPHYLSWILLIFVVVITAPRIVFETSLNIKRFLKPEGFLITNEELALYQFIDKDAAPDEVVAVDPNHYLGKNTPYVSLFINQPLLVSGNGLLKHFRINIEKEEKSQTLIFGTEDEKLLAKELLTNRIKYILLYENNRLSTKKSNDFTFVVIKNKEGSVLKVSREGLLKALWRKD